MQDAVQIVRAQAELMAEIPSMLAELQRTARDMSEMLVAVRETVASSQRVSARVELVLDEIEAPLRAMVPGVNRLAIALDDPVIDRIPHTLSVIEQAIGPIGASLERLRDRSAHLAARGRRLSRRVSALGGHGADPDPVPFAAAADHGADYADQPPSVPATDNDAQ